MNKKRNKIKERKRKQGNNKNKKIDDLKLIELLVKNSRLSYTAIAKKFKVSETAVRKRIRKLEEQGVIKRYTISFDLKKLSYNIHALIGLDAKPEAYIEVIEKIKELKDTRSVYTSTGDHMLLIEVWFENSKQLREFVKKLKTIKGITRVCPAVLLEKVK